MGYKVDRPEPTFLEKIYVTEVVKGMGVATRHFVRNLFGRKDTVTVQYPEDAAYLSRAQSRSLPAHVS